MLKIGQFPQRRTCSDMRVSSLGGKTGSILYRTFWPMSLIVVFAPFLKSAYVRKSPYLGRLRSKGYARGAEGTGASAAAPTAVMPGAKPQEGDRAGGAVGSRRAQDEPKTSLRQ
eukprot:SAG11_NODE_1375_length_5086_cov_98.730499_7_plen_114_part_00